MLREAFHSPGDLRCKVWMEILLTDKSTKRLCDPKCRQKSCSKRMQNRASCDCKSHVAHTTRGYVPPFSFSYLPALLQSWVCLLCGVKQGHKDVRYSRRGCFEAKVSFADGWLDICTVTGALLCFVPLFLHARALLRDGGGTMHGQGHRGCLRCRHLGVAQN